MIKKSQRNREKPCLFANHTDSYVVPLVVRKKQHPGGQNCCCSELLIPTTGTLRFFNGNLLAGPTPSLSGWTLCLCKFVCFCVCDAACVCEFMCVYAYEYVCVRVWACVFECAYACSYVCVFVCVCVSTCRRLCVSVSVLLLFDQNVHRGLTWHVLLQNDHHTHAHSAAPTLSWNDFTWAEMVFVVNGFFFMCRRRLKERQKAREKPKEKI